MHAGTAFLKQATLAVTILPAMMLLSSGAGAYAQDKPAEPKPVESYQTFYLTNVTRQEDANDIQTALRNMLPPRARVYYAASQAALSVRGTAEDMEIAQKIIADLDHSKKTYRLTYTLTETDGGKPVGTKHFTLLIASGGKAYFKQGIRVPVVTGTSATASQTPQAQVQYLDVGLNVDANLEGYQDGVRLRTKVEQTAVADEKSGIGAQDPVIHQTTMDATSTLGQGKSVVLGSLDMPESTRHQEVSVVAEVVK